MLVRHIARWLVFPAVMGAALTAMAIALARGYEPELALVAISVASTGSVIALERLLPFRTAWNQSHGDFATDAVHGLMTLMIIPSALQALCFAALYRFSAQLGGWLDTPLWPENWPLAGQLVLALLLTELGQYWLHRAMHQWPLLWRVHAIHHSAPRLYWLNGARVHPVDTVLTFAVGLLLLVALGAPQDTLALFLCYTGTHTTLQHCNVDMRIGWLNWLCSQAELHRFHHAPEPTESNHNYGTVLIVWDVVFGTRWLPSGREPPTEPGIADMPDFPRGYLGQVLAPLRWRRFVRPAAPAEHESA